MKIITISREFGSGGREVGKRLADALGFQYYDREIITAVAQKSSLDEEYVEKTNLFESAFLCLETCFTSSKVTKHLTIMSFSIS